MPSGGRTVASRGIESPIVVITGITTATRDLLLDNSVNTGLELTYLTEKDQIQIMLNCPVLQQQKLLMIEEYSKGGNTLLQGTAMALILGTLLPPPPIGIVQ